MDKCLAVDVVCIFAGVKYSLMGRSPKLGACGGSETTRLLLRIALTRLLAGILLAL
jgi:hypothetical protein